MSQNEHDLSSSNFTACISSKMMEILDGKLDYENEQMEEFYNSPDYVSAHHDSEILSLIHQSKNEIEDINVRIAQQEKQLQDIQNEIQINKETIENESKPLRVIETSLQTVLHNKEITITQIDEVQTQIEDVMRQIELTKQQLAESQDNLFHSEKQRKVLHNEMMELKGNIRVFCRVRPIIFAPSATMYVKENSIVYQQTGFSGNVEKLSFTFDRIFSSLSTQDDVFSEISQLVQSSLDGYETCIFAYGQTGSGKTYTMEGEESHPGMIPLAVLQIFKTIRDLEKIGWVYKVSVRHIEVYNNNIFDLLINGQNSAKLQIKYDKGKIVLPNATNVVVANESEIFKLLQIAHRNRSVAETEYNTTSSRSHSIFILELCGENTEFNQRRLGGLTLVDLAGSEKLNRTIGIERVEETKSINVSLCALRDVIAAISSKASHIPYRNSKLTEVLQNCLGTNSKMLMFVNVSPDERDILETISSLRFATTVNKCSVGVVTRKL
ncbi:kifc1, putative [Entamoeba invadens IP1]|uniref:Kifc1, putative n=1 Tax=Entamoeba invadens IP1 TaxID=370355 RepID=L7FLE4_ENTIV|nr:kifc1, putative [Entamoeba invadens IP1]ELP83989.1 kifc1, putative [Entamoeba invadens IP1]|eukprot:XP_004183335.1 kifc1, putative [Entamoeba invadens IP1]